MTTGEAASGLGDCKGMGLEVGVSSTRDVEVMTPVVGSGVGETDETEETGAE